MASQKANYEPRQESILRASRGKDHNMLHGAPDRPALPAPVPLALQEDSDDSMLLMM